jgi:hypothetical protein
MKEKTHWFSGIPGAKEVFVQFFIDNMCIYIVILT